MDALRRRRARSTPTATCASPGRKKDLIITAAGQNIAPQEIETDLRYHDLISEAVVVGEGRRYLTALLTLDGDALAAWAEAHDKIAGFEALAADPDLRAEIDRDRRRGEQHAGRGSRTSASTGSSPTSFTIAGGELTPTLKVKRNVVNEQVRRPDRRDVRRGVTSRTGDALTPVAATEPARRARRDAHA